MKTFSIDQYIEFNSSISSEMFISVMSIIQERLPCSSFYFRQRRQFKHTLAIKKDGMSSTMRDSFHNGSPSHRRYSQRAQPNNSELTQYVTAIAQPRIIPAWSPMKKHGAARMLDSSRRVDDSPDFRIRGGAGMTTDAHRHSALLNSSQ